MQAQSLCPGSGGGPPAPAAPASNCCHTVCRSGPRSSPPVCGIRYPGGAVCLRWRWHAERAGSGRGRQRECSGRLCALRQRNDYVRNFGAAGQAPFWILPPSCRHSPAGWTCCKHPLVSESISAPPGWTLRWHMASQNSGGCRDAGNSSLYALDSTGYVQPLRPQAARCDRRQRVYRYLYDGGHL